MDASLTWSYHTHNEYCDGAGTVDEVVQAAIAAGLKEIGISSHAPLPFETAWTMPAARLEAYLQDVRAAQRRYSRHITVLLGAEIDFIPDPRVAAFQRRAIFPRGFDYFVGSVHFLGGGYPPRTFDGAEEEFRDLLRREYQDDIERMAVDYYTRVRQMLSMPGVRIVGHLDLIKRWNADRRYFRGDEPWYLAAVERTLEAIAASGQIVELNTAGWHKGLGDPYPAPWILRRCAEYGIPLTVNSDAHSPAELTRGYVQALACLDRLGAVPRPLPPRS